MAAAFGDRQQASMISREPPILARARRPSAFAEVIRQSSAAAPSRALLSQFLIHGLATRVVSDPPIPRGILKPTAEATIPEPLS
jgi:hypothetical protein